MRITAVPTPVGPGAAALMPALAAAIDGRLTIAPFDPQHGGAPEPEAEAPDGVAVLMRTSGSTGSPKVSMLSADALLASARSALERLGGPGQWLLALPAAHIGGLQVLLRSHLAGIDPVFARFDGPAVARFVDATAELAPGVRHYTSLVPTQVSRLLRDPAGTQALAAYDAVLVGGAAIAADDLARAQAAGARLVPTYGMSETGGGCVYDGVPLSGVTVAVDEAGVVSLGGATLADGYLSRPEATREAFSTDPAGTRWFRTDDLGEFDQEGRLRVRGRADEVIITGGVKVSPAVVAPALTAALPWVREAVVVGLPDGEWGQVVAAYLVSDDPPDQVSVAAVRDALRASLPAHALPRVVAAATTLPTRGPGKPDLAAVRAALERVRAHVNP